MRATAEESEDVLRAMLCGRYVSPEQRAKVDPHHKRSTFKNVEQAALFAVVTSFHEVGVLDPLPMILLVGDPAWEGTSREAVALELARLTGAT